MHLLRRLSSELRKRTSNGAAPPPAPPSAEKMRVDLSPVGRRCKIPRSEMRADSAHCWCDGDAGSVVVRGANYMEDQKKVASAWSFYAATMASMVDSPEGILHNVASRVRLPPCDAATAKLCAEHNIPRVLVINLIVPMTIGFLGGVKPESRHRQAIVLCTPSPELLCELAKENPFAGGGGASFRLFQRWCRECTTDETVKGRFKLIMKLLNVEELKRLKKVPVNLALLNRFNAKPLMVDRSGRPHRGLDESGRLSYVEYEINYGTMNRLMRKGIAAQVGKVPVFEVSVSAVIEGRDPKELPEQLLFAVHIRQMDLFDSNQFVTPMTMTSSSSSSPSSSSVHVRRRGAAGAGVREETPPTSVCQQAAGGGGGGGSPPPATAAAAKKKASHPPEADATAPAKGES